MEELISIKSGSNRLQGYWQKGNDDKGVVITHPHPLYGGTMNNPVVETIQSAYQQTGYATLRFNFRGVGGSQGQFDHGAGEQDDVRAAITMAQNKGIGTIDLAGYSFGAWVNAGIAADGSAPIAAMLMVSPPVGFIEFDHVTRLGCLQLVVSGSRDDIAPVDKVRALLPNWNPAARFEIIDGCDHFYAGYLDQLQAILTAFLQTRKIQ